MKCVMYHNTATEEPSHGHRQRAQKSTAMWFSRYVSQQTYGLTYHVTVCTRLRDEETILCANSMSWVARWFDGYIAWLTITRLQFWFRFCVAMLSKYVQCWTRTYLLLSFSHTSYSYSQIWCQTEQWNSKTWHQKRPLSGWCFFPKQLWWNAHMAH